MNFIVIRKLKKNHPKALDKGGSPSGLWNNTTNASFTLGYIGLRLYRHDKLDKNTLLWCNGLSVLVWVLFAIIINELYNVIYVY